MSISLHGLLSSKSFLQIQIVLITLLQRKIPNFDALLPILCVEWMNECLMTPQHKKQIGNWVSEKGFYVLVQIPLSIHLT